MSSQKNCDSKVMTEAELIREIYPRHAMKMLARVLDAPLDTARHLLYRKFSATRRRELALKLLRELDAQEQRRMGVRRQLQAMANEKLGEVGDARGGENFRAAPVAESRPRVGKEGG